MACRATGWGMLAAASVQETMDFALISQAATLRSRIPFVHFFDGFRTSHEVSKIEVLAKEDLKALINDGLIAEHRARAMTPDKPVLRGTAQNPDAFFQQVIELHIASRDRRRITPDFLHDPPLFNFKLLPDALPGRGQQNRI